VRLGSPVPTFADAIIVSSVRQYAVGVAAADVLLEACRLSPDDDAPRLVWADAVGGERGELVVIQCDLARGDLPPGEAAIRRRRERELLERHGDEWAGIRAYQHPGSRPRREFRRGFVEAAELDPRMLAEHGEEIFQRAPLLRSITTIGTLVSSGDPLAGLRALLRSPALRRLRGLDLSYVGVQAQPLAYEQMRDGHGDEAVRLLVGSGALARLRALGISWSGLGAVGMHHLVVAGGLEHVAQLWLRGHDLGGGADLGGDAVLAVLARAPHVTSLDLYGTTDFEAILPALPPVTELHLSELTDETLALLGTSRAAATLARLRLSLSAFEQGDGFGAFPRLRELDLRNARFADPERGARAIAALPALRRLRVMPSAPVSVLRLIAHALGPQLEELDLSNGDWHEPRLLRELRALVAGEVIDGPLNLADALL